MNTNRRNDSEQDRLTADPRRRSAVRDFSPRGTSRGAATQQSARREDAAAEEWRSAVTEGLLPAAMGLLIWLAAILIVLGERMP